MSEENTNQSTPESSNPNPGNINQSNTSNQGGPEFKPWGMEEKTFCMLMHLSQFLVYFTGIGVIAPIVMWLTNQGKSEFIDAHGKSVTNWLISWFIYGTVSVVLSCFIIGYFTGLALIIIGIIFPIIAAMKANKGENYKYPLTISFIK